VSIWQLLLQFIFRLTFGIALAMGVTPARHVTSGFYRVHLWVLMGLNVLAALAAYSQRAALTSVQVDWRLAFGLALAMTLLSYVGAVAWLYEKSQLGTTLILVISAVALAAAALATSWLKTRTPFGVTLAMLDLASSGVLLGVTMAAMFLGHWYLNTPTMELLPLKRLVAFMAAAILVRTLVSAAGLVLQLQAEPEMDTAIWIFIAFRWLSGLLGTLLLALMTWETLKVPNTQSATGILYAGVILTFLGELTSQLLSVETLYPI